MNSMSISENAGITLAAWDTGAQVLYTKILGAAERTLKPVAAPGEGKGRKHPRVAMNSRGETILVWTEGTSWGHGGSLVWQVFEAQEIPWVRRAL
jgi:hypothetical protein